MNQDINTCSGSVAVDGWTYPLSHFIQSSIYAENRDGKKHYAVDLAVGEGSNVYISCVNLVNFIKERESNTKN